MNYLNFISELDKELRRHRNKTRASGAKAYMREQFEYLGISSPQRKELLKYFLAEHEIPPYEEFEELMKELWQKEEREFQYVAMELSLKYRKYFQKKDIRLIEWLMLNKSWWDTVDFVAPKLAQHYFWLFPETKYSITAKWIESKNIWLMRSALIFQLHPKEEVDEKLLFHNIRQCLYHKDFFIRKAIGWSLRQYGKSNPKAVLKFVKENALSPLSVKEALRRIK